ncbi:MAG: hypothetical protein RLZZ58_737 [Pseudomonadota bacterium]
MKTAAIIPAILLLSACGGAATAPASSRPATVSTRPAPAYPGSATAPGSLIGRDARALTGLFGTPRLDMREGTARRIQFAGSACVLDLYLYPQSSGREPVVTHIDARLPDGRDTAADGCADALRRK